MAYYDPKRHSTEEIDKAWNDKRYNDVLGFLKRDWVFPKGFEIEELKNGDDGQNLLKKFVEGRMKLHEEIRKGNLEEVEKLTSGKDSKSNVYLNPEDRSAAFTALQSKQFPIYAYLKSIGVSKIDFKGVEQSVLKELSCEDKVVLKEMMRLYFPLDTIKVLTWRSKSHQKDFRPKVEDYFKKLYEKIPEILEVVQYENDLEIQFDFDKSDVSDLCLLRARGLTDSNEKTVSVACNRKGEAVLGTLAHELAHLAMHIIFKNNFNPYGKFDKIGWDSFEKIKQKIETKFKDLEENPEENLESEEMIVSRVFRCYGKEKRHCELIVRVPHILSEFENGYKWLNENVSELLKFYEQNILPKCKEFISQSYLLKPRRLVRDLNEQIGEMIHIKRCHLFFKNLDFLEECLKRRKISCFVTKNTRIGLFRVLQAFYGRNYVDFYDNFIVLKFKDCIKELNGVKVVFFSEATDSLVLDCKSVNKKSLKEGALKIIKELGTKKKIVFVLEENQTKTVEELLKMASSIDCHIENDRNFLLNDLDAESKKCFLDKKVILQGNEMTLNEFGTNEEFCKSIGADTIGKLFENETHHIGSKIFGISSLEGSYAQIVQPVNVASLISEIQNSDCIFIFTGEKDQMITRLHLENIPDNQIGDIDLKNDFDTDKRILLADRNFENDFKNFCQSNPAKKVYLINMKCDETFTLLQIYNPDFYIPREIWKNVMKVDEVIELIHSLPYTTFIITGENLPNSLTNYSNVQISEERNAKIVFLKKSGKPTCWFHLKGDVFIWKDRNFSIVDILPFLDKDLLKKILVEEKELINEIVDEKVIIIADEPGMGKSTTVTKLYETDTIIKNHWIIRINLKDHLDVIKRINPSNFTISNVINFLKAVDSKSNNKLAEIILNLILRLDNDFSKYSLLLTFDGFDELLDEEDRNTIIRLFKYLKDETKCKIWITSRLQYKKLLEKELQTFTFQIDPIDNTMKRQFIKKYYKDRLNLIISKEQFDDIFNENDEVMEDTKLSIYIEKFIEKMAGIFQGDISTVFGTPLQLHLLLDNSIEYFKNWLNKNDFILNFFYLGNDPFEIYERYIDRRYELYFKKTNVDQELLRNMIKQHLEQYHEDLAGSFYFNKAVKNVRKYDSLILLIGLTQLYNQNLQFFHFTFREYYCAKIFIKLMMNCDIRAYKFIEVVKKYILDILGTRKSSRLIRKFIDLQLEKINFKKIPKENIKLFAKTFFLLWKQYSSETGTRSMDHPYPEASLHLCIFEKNSSLFKFIFSSLIRNCEPRRYIYIIMSKDWLDHTLLHWATGARSEKKIWNILDKTIHRMPLQHRRRVLLSKSSDPTALNYAFLRGNPDVVKELLKRAQILLLPEELTNFYISVNIWQLPMNSSPNHLEVIELILDEAEVALPVNHQREFLRANYENPSLYRLQQDVVYKLFERGEKVLPFEDFSKVFTKDFDDRFRAITRHTKPIHMIAESNHCKVLELLYKKYKQDHLDQTTLIHQILTARNYSDRETALGIAIRCGCVEFTQLLLDISKEEFSHDQQRNFIMVQDHKDGTLLHSAVLSSSCLKISKLLFKYIFDVLEENEQKPFLMTRDAYNFTALHYAFTISRDDSSEIQETMMEISKEILSEEELNHLKLELDRGIQEYRNYRNTIATLGLSRINITHIK